MAEITITVTYTREKKIQVSDEVLRDRDKLESFVSDEADKFWDDPEASLRWADTTATDEKGEELVSIS